MMYRKLDVNGDYVFGQQTGNFYIDQVEAVAQAIKTRLGLFKGEWFIDTTLGTPYNTHILGAGTISRYDQAIQDVITNTPGVKALTDYKSGVNPFTRAAQVTCSVDTLYGGFNLLWLRVPREAC
jgi:hypothetical protein